MLNLLTSTHSQRILWQCVERKLLILLRPQRIQRIQRIPADLRIHIRVRVHIHKAFKNSVECVECVEKHLKTDSYNQRIWKKCVDIALIFKKGVVSWG